MYGFGARAASLPHFEDLDVAEETLRRGALDVVVHCENQVPHISREIATYLESKGLPAQRRVDVTFFCRDTPPLSPVQTKDRLFGEIVVLGEPDAVDLAQYGASEFEREDRARRDSVGHRDLLPAIPDNAQRSAALQHAGSGVLVLSGAAV